MLAFIAVFALSTLVFGAPPNQDLPDRCASHPTDQQKSIAKTRYSSKRPSSAAHTAAKAGPVPVHWHVISAGDSYARGNVPQNQVESSISVLNSAFAPSGLSFILANTTRTQSSQWFTGASIYNEIQTQMKTKLHVGDKATLNVYTVELSGFLGYATFPSDYEDAPLDDGVVIRFSTLPGGSSPKYNLGMTLVHEVGHWAGLYHTFEGGCFGQGDEVADTPPSASESRGCPVGRDSCRGGGKDPITNYMDYSDDNCLDRFTPGQITRMKNQVLTFRDINI